MRSEDKINVGIKNIILISSHFSYWMGELQAQILEIISDNN